MVQQFWRNGGTEQRSIVDSMRVLITTFHDNQNPLSKVIFKMVVTNSNELFSCQLCRGLNLYNVTNPQNWEKVIISAKK